MSVIHVAVGVIRNHQHQILIAKRPAHVHLGGLWEFPGGKVEVGETVQQALQRELKEEINITFDVANSQPIIQITHHYPEKTVLLDVWSVSDVKGQVYGREHQMTKWVALDELHQFDFPEANKAIVAALTLPQRYLITGDFLSQVEFTQRLNAAIKNNISLIQLRAKKLHESDFINLAKHATTLCHQHNVKIILNTSPEVFDTINADGLHLTASRLMQYQSRPITNKKYLLASCHNESEIQQAAKIGVDAIVLGFVKITTSHPHAIALGWQRFAQLVELAPVPVFALGGLGEADLQTAREQGAQGVAGVSAWW
jgi:8-oxo-dGTP diphosphatase